MYRDVKKTTYTQTKTTKNHNPYTKQTQTHRHTRKQQNPIDLCLG